MGKSELKTKTTKSLFWSFIDKFGEQLLNLLSMYILMNIVSTEDYGIYGSLAVLSAVLPLLIDSGFGRALINKKKLTEISYNTMFYFNVVMSIFLYLSVYFLIPTFANSLKVDSEILIPVARLLFLGLVINAFGLIQKTLLTKKADFKTLTRTNLTALTLANVVAIFMAIKGYGVWSLVAQQVLIAFFRTLLLWLYSSWRPRLMFQWKVLGELFGFSNKLVLASFVGTISNNIYPTLISAFYPVSQVAFFDRAKRYEEIPFLMLSNTYRSVSMLILSEINEQRERLHRVMSKMSKSIAFAVFPIAIYMVIVASPVFYALFKDKWMDAVPYFQILTFAGMFMPFITIVNELFISTERSAYFLGLEIVKSILLALLIIAFFSGGIKGLAVSWIVYNIVSLTLSLYFSRKLIAYSIGNFISDILPYITLASVSGVFAALSLSLFQNEWLQIFVATSVMGFSYILLCNVFKLEMSKEIKDLFSDKKKAKK